MNSYSRSARNLNVNLICLCDANNLPAIVGVAGSYTCFSCRKTYNVDWITTGDELSARITEIDDFKDTNPKSKAATNRLPLSLVPGSLDAFVSLGMCEGDAKYGGYNFRVKGVRVSTYLDALKRHIARFEAGEWADPETKVPHLASMGADVAIIIDGFVQENIYDDRPPAQPGLLKFLEESKSTVEHLYETFNNDENPRMTEKNKHEFSNTD